jgi:hypothetical protein
MEMLDQLLKWAKDNTYSVPFGEDGMGELVPVVIYEELEKYIYSLKHKKPCPFCVDYVSSTCEDCLGSGFVGEDVQDDKLPPEPLEESY